MRFASAALVVSALFACASALSSFYAVRWTMLCVLPYAVLALLVIGVVRRALYWSASPVPFRITVTAGQQASLPWIPSGGLDNPSSRLAAALRVAIDVLFFRTLLKNTTTEKNRETTRLAYASSLGLWFFSLMFHISLFVIIFRHLRYFTADVPTVVRAVERADGFFRLTVPTLYVTSALFIVGGLFLSGRRLFSGKIRYLSSFSDHFFILLMLFIGVSGVLLRHVFKTDVVDVKSFALGIVTFQPMCPSSLSPLFFGHFFSVMLLFSLFPFSKLVHGFGLLFSPTRNMRGDSRATRHVNPWNDPSILPRSYADYEDEFRDKMKAANIPVERQ